MEGEGEGGGDGNKIKEPREAITTDTVRGRVGCKEEGQKGGRRESSGGEAVVLEEGGELGEVGLNN